MSEECFKAFINLLEELKVPIHEIDWEECIIRWPNGLYAMSALPGISVQMQVHDDDCHYGQWFEDHQEAAEFVQRNYEIPNGTL